MERKCLDEIWRWRGINLRLSILLMFEDTFSLETAHIYHEEGFVWNIFVPYILYYMVRALTLVYSASSWDIKERELTGSLGYPSKKQYLVQ